MTREELEKQILDLLSNKVAIGAIEPISINAKELTEEIASLIEQKPDCYPKEAIVKYPIDVNGEVNKKVSYCYHCGTNVHKQKYCHGCGYKLIWQTIKDKP